MTRRNRSGFTLIEVVVALAIMVVIGVLAFSTLAGAVEMRDTMEASDKTSRSARIALDRLSRELQLAFLSQNFNPLTYQTVFIGRQSGDESTLWFATTSHRRAYHNSREADQAEITVWTEDEEEGEGMVLLHRESGIVDQEPDEGGSIMPLARNVTQFEVAFLDSRNGEWISEWDSTGVDTPNTLPRAVQIVLGLSEPDPLDDDDTIERIFVRTVYLERGPRIQTNLLGSN
ncbi:MAG: prepilin-type N-terminal cleavage/methylation domain-containing protein [Myxococcota bacterium]